jgi:hypothetical protein
MNHWAIAESIILGNGTVKSDRATISYFYAEKLAPAICQ